jgi:hypothetical protein
MFNRWPLGLICLTLVMPVIPVAVIAFDAPVSPPPMVSMAESLKPVGSAEFPAPRQFRAGWRQPAILRLSRGDR